MPSAHTSDKNRTRIFLRPVPSKKIFPYGNIAEQQFGFTVNFQGVGTGLIEILQQLLTKVKRDGIAPHFAGKHQLHVLPG
jgi:hypothetical protein